MAHYKKIAGLEKITIDDEALQIIARAADGSVRDGLSLLDQAIAQANDQPITGTTIRSHAGSRRPRRYRDTDYFHVEWRDRPYPRHVTSLASIGRRPDGVAG
jgi:DNA polymerase III delta prime subunit